MRDGIFILFVLLIMILLISLTIFVLLAIVALDPEISLWFRIPAFLVDTVSGGLVGYATRDFREPL